MDDATFEALARLEGRLDALREAWLGLVVMLTHRDRSLENSVLAALQGAFVEASDKNPHAAMGDELRSLKDEIEALRVRRDAPGG